MSNANWEGLCRAVGHPEWLDDPRFKTPALRDENANARLELTQSALVHNTTNEWLEILDDAGVPCAPVLKRKEMIHHPQVRASGIVIETEHPHAGRLRQARNAARFEGTPTEIRHHAPHHGEHTRELLGELGLAQEEIDQLQESGVISIYEGE
jgi:crotonobetainyl-CoA:carnitine CoA-transferase CaiB-like acyl-CoA transferase